MLGHSGWTTFFGISVIDAWYLKQKRKQKMFNDDEKTRISEFANELAWSLLQKGKSFTPTPTCIIANNNSTDDSISKLTNATESSEGSHSQLFLMRTRKDDYYVRSRRYKKASQARCMWCSRVHGNTNVKTQLICVECDAGFCNERSGRPCWRNHIVYGGVPESPSKKRRHDRFSSAISVDY